MPSTATITAFYSFTANTKARASQVNANFDVFRGHLLPIDPNTATAINNTYDLGSSEYYWNRGYIGTLYRSAITTSTSAGINGLATSARLSASNIFGATTGQIEIANSTITIQSLGRPILIKFTTGNTSGGAFIGGGQNRTVFGFTLWRDSTQIGSFTFPITDTNLSYNIAGTGVLELPPAGTHNYHVKYQTIAYTSTSGFSYAFQLAAIEL